MTPLSFRVALGAVLVAVLACLGGSQTSSAQEPERRVALVIGVGAYQNAPQLANPVRDARAIGDALRQLNFAVDELYDPDDRALTRAIRDFGVKAQKANVAVVFYAGHGVQAAKENYLIPADARLQRERDLLYEAVPLDLMLGEVSQASKLGMVLLDACRDNPFAERLSRSMPSNGLRAPNSGGLARIDNVPRNMLVAMSTKADTVAEDGVGTHSPFATALLAKLGEPGLELSLLFRGVRDTVLQATQGRQEPYVFSSVGAEPFYLNPKPVARLPNVEAARRIRMYTGPIGIVAPTDPAGGPVQVVIKSVPRGVVRDGARAIRPGDRLTPEQLAGLMFLPEPGYVGNAGLLGYQAATAQGGVADSAIEIEVMDTVQATDEMAQAALWEKVRGTGKAEDIDLFLRLYPTSRFAAAGQQLQSKLAPMTVATVTGPALAGAQVAMAPPLRGFAGLAAPTEFRDCPTCPVMVRVPAGEFTMGLASTDPAAKPPHRVRLAAFALGQAPVTIAEWQACLDAGGCGPLPRIPSTNPAIPLHNVSWDDAQIYITWLSRTTGQSYRLPSEAEWEYAARAGSAARYPWGEQLGVARANCANCGGTQDPKAPAQTRSFPPNAFGLYDMGGGVAQWVKDCWTPNYVGAPTDGVAHDMPGCRQRVLRGGSFRSTSDNIIPSARNSYDAPVRYLTNGFRIARSVD